MSNINLRRFQIKAMTSPSFKDYPNGWYYGELVRGKRHGQGMFFWPGGEAYMGGWNNDVRSGYGIQRNSSGGMHIGNWHSRFMSGWGVEFEQISPTINFELPEDEELREAMGDLVEEHRNYIMDDDYSFGDVFEGVFRGTKPGGYGTKYRRDSETGAVTSWTVGTHNKSERLDGYGVKFEGLHPLFQDIENRDDIDPVSVAVHSFQGEYIDGDLLAGPATQTISHWFRGAAIQVITITGQVNANGMFEGLTSVSLDNNVIYTGRVWVDEDADEDNQVFSILDEEDSDMIIAQRNNTKQDIIDGVDPKKYDSSALVPTIADVSPEASWVLHVCKGQHESAMSIKGEQDAEQARLQAGKLEYTNRFFVTDSDDDVVSRHDGARVTISGFEMDFDLAFNPTFSKRLDTDEDGNPLTVVYIMSGNKIVGDFKYNNHVLTINTDAMEIARGVVYNDDGMRIYLPISDAEGTFEYRQYVEQDWMSSDAEGADPLTREETIALEEALATNNNNDDPEGMDVERDEDGNVTGMGFSMTGNNPDQEAQNLNTLLNVFKNGGHFAPIDEIMEDAKKSK